MSPYICITNLLACRLILQLQTAYHQPVQNSQEQEGYHKGIKSSEVSTNRHETIELQTSV